MIRPSSDLPPDVVELVESLIETYQTAFDDLDHRDLGVFIAEEARIRKIYREKLERIAKGES